MSISLLLRLPSRSSSHGACLSKTLLTRTSVTPPSTPHGREWKSTYSAFHQGIQNTRRAQNRQSNSPRGDDAPPNRTHDRRDTLRRQVGKRAFAADEDDGRQPWLGRGRSAGRSREPKPNQEWEVKSQKKDRKRNDKGEEGKPMRMSRRKRFADPDQPYGKKSLVYQVQYGELKDTAVRVLSENERDQQQRTAEWRAKNSNGLLESLRSVFPDEPPKKSTTSETDAYSAFEKAARQQTHRLNSSSPKKNTWQLSRSWTDEEERQPTKSNQTRQQWGRESSRVRRGPDFANRKSDRPGPNSRTSESEKWPTSRRSDDGREARNEGGDREDRKPYSRDEREDRREKNGRERSFRPGSERSRDSAPARGSRSSVHAPLVIPYTTAASQFLYGRSVVYAALLAKKRKLYKLYVYTGDNRRGSAEEAAILALADTRQLPVIRVESTEELALMNRMSESRPHNGFVLEASPIPQMPVHGLRGVIGTAWKPKVEVTRAPQSREEEDVNGSDDTIAYAAPVHQKPLVLVLDEIIDPGNLGAILRTAQFLGVSAVGVTKSNSATVTPVVLKSSAGASEELPLFRIDNSTVDFLHASRRFGWKVFAAVAPHPTRSKTETSAVTATTPQLTTHEVEALQPLAHAPTVLVLGSEGWGLSRKVRQQADYEVVIPRGPQRSVVDSLNVSVAAGLLCQAFLRPYLEAARPSSSSSVLQKEETPDQPIAGEKLF